MFVENFIGVNGPSGSNLLNSQMINRSISGHFDPYQYPADLDAAQDHGRTKRVYAAKTRDQSLDESVRVCICCDQPIGGERLPLCTSLTEMYHLGSGYALYFRFLKSAIALLVMVFIISGLHNILTNISGNGCSDDLTQYCYLDYVTRFTIANKRDSPKDLNSQLYLNFVTVLAIIAFVQYTRYRVRCTEAEANRQTVTPADFTIKVNGNIVKVSTEKLQEWIESWDKTLKVKNICRTYYLREYARREAVVNALVYAKAKESNPLVVTRIDQDLREAYNKIRELKKGGFKFTRVAYITFETVQQATSAIRHFKHMKKSRKLNFKNLFEDTVDIETITKIKMKKAPQPSDVLWANLGFIKASKLKRRAFTIIVAAFMVFIGFSMNVGISSIQKGFIEGKYGIISQVLSGAAAFLIIVINFGLAKFIFFLAEFERHSTMTNYYKGVAEKLSLAQLINTAFTPLAAKVALVLFFDHHDDTLSSFNFYGKSGLLEVVFYGFITNAIISPLYYLLDPSYFSRQYKQHKILKNPASCKLNQKEAHILFEGSNFNMAYRNASLIKIMLFTCFYAPAIPIAILISITGLILMFWVDKYLLLRRAALPSALGAELTRPMINYLEASALMYALGNIFFYFTLQNSSGSSAFDPDSEILIWVSLIVSLASMFFPMVPINRRLFKVDEHTRLNEVYDDAKWTFQTDYASENPVTRHRAINEKKDSMKWSSIKLKDLSKPQIKERSRPGRKLNDVFSLLDDLVAEDGGNEETSMVMTNTYIKDAYNEKPSRFSIEPNGKQRYVY